MILEFFIYLLVGALSIWIVVRYWLRSHRENAQSKERLSKATEQNLIEPVSLHPKIDPTSCISAGACIKACPEGDILGFVNGHVELVAPTKCIGHGACQEACPVNAIELVFGTERRGVDIPQVNERFETNIPGIYIAGELGGMGLIRNAVTQGREAVEYISQSNGSSGSNGSNSSDLFDLLIVGAGPAGIAATLQAKKSGLKYKTIEQDGIGGAALSYPRQKVVMTQPMDIPLYGKFKDKRIQKEELLELWDTVVKETGVQFNTEEKVNNVVTEDGAFKVITSKSEYKAKNILLSIGRRGSPRKLGVPGEDSAKVTYTLLEPEQYIGKHSLVIGGGNSAAEAAIALCDQEGATVTLSCRTSVMEATNEENRNLLDGEVNKGRLTILYESAVSEILPDEVILDYVGKQVTVPNDFVFVFIGGILPTGFLQQVGIEVEKKYGQR